MLPSVKLVANLEGTNSSMGKNTNNDSAMNTTPPASAITKAWNRCALQKHIKYKGATINSLIVRLALAISPMTRLAENHKGFRGRTATSRTSNRFQQESIHLKTLLEGKTSDLVCQLQRHHCYHSRPLKGMTCLPRMTTSQTVHHSHHCLLLILKNFLMRFLSQQQAVMPAPS